MRAHTPACIQVRVQAVFYLTLRVAHGIGPQPATPGNQPCAFPLPFHFLTPGPSPFVDPPTYPTLPPPFLLSPSILLCLHCQSGLESLGHTSGHMRKLMERSRSGNMTWNVWHHPMAEAWDGTEREKRDRQQHTSIPCFPVPGTRYQPCTLAMESCPVPSCPAGLCPLRSRMESHRQPSSQTYLLGISSL